MRGHHSTKAIAFALASLISHSAAAATTNLSGAGSWTALLKGANFDPFNDQQASSAGTDIVGNASRASFYFNYDDNGTPSISDDTLSLRVRIGDETKATYSANAFVGVDVNGDGKLDVFVSSDGASISIWDPGTAANTSPSTTSIDSHAPKYTYAHSSSNYDFANVSATNDPDWDGANDMDGNGKTDRFVSFAVPVVDLASYLSTKGFTLTASTQMRFISLTATQPNSLNADFNGLNGRTNWTQTFASLGLFTSPVTSGGVVDTTAPAAPTVTPLLTNNTKPTVTGTFDATDAAGGFTVKVNGVTYRLGTDAELTATGNNWSLALPTALAQNSYDVVATATDGAGNSASDSSLNELVIDTAAPALPTVNLLTTSNATPTVTGTWPASDAAGGLTVLVNGITYRLGVDAALTANGNNWSLAIGTSLPQATYDVTATVKDAAGNSATDATNGELTIDAAARTAPTVDALTSNATSPTITGSYSGTLVSVTINGHTYTPGDGYLTDNGSTWSLAGVTLPNGTYTVTVVANDGLGDLSGTNSVVIDRTAPSAPTVNGLTTNITTPTLTGTYDSADAAGGLAVTVNGVTYHNGDGHLTTSGDNWSLTIPAPLASPATYAVTAMATDEAGNAASDTTNNELVLDPNARPNPTVNALTTRSTTPALTGTSIPGAALVVRVDGTDYTPGDGHLTVGPTGVWTLQLPNLPEGPYEVAVTEDDGQGSLTDKSVQELVIDRTAPTLPTVTIAPASGPTITLTGTYSSADAAGGLKVTINGVTYTPGDGYLSTSGDDWTLTLPAPLPAGTYPVTVSVSDAAGNTATASANMTVAAAESGATPTQSAQIETGLNGIGGCTVGTGAEFDPVLIIALLLSMVYVTRSARRGAKV